MSALLFFAGRRKGADVAAWKQSARAEAAAAIDDSDYAIALLNMVKAFERVPHDILVRHAVKNGYDLWLLRLSLAAYLLGRAVGIHGVFSVLLFASRGITAGSTFATAELRLLLIDLLDEVSRAFPLVTLAVYVDDIGAEIAATKRLVLRLLAEAVRRLAAGIVALRMEL